MPDARHRGMATTTNPSFELHDHTGARWLAAAGIPLLFAILAAFAMMIYPHL
jgi:hypothetical protein